MLTPKPPDSTPKSAELSGIDVPTPPSGPSPLVTTGEVDRSYRLEGLILKARQRLRALDAPETSRNIYHILPQIRREELQQH